MTNQMPDPNQLPVVETPRFGNVLDRRRFLGVAGALVAGHVLSPLFIDLDPEVKRYTELGEPIEPAASMEVRTITETTDLTNAIEWGYTPAVTADETGLTIEDVPLEISDKRLFDIYEPPIDYRVYKPNAPINKYGGHIQVDGDFSLKTSLGGDEPASFDMLGQMPYFTDDWRHEYGRMQFKFEGDKLHVLTWDGQRPEPERAEFRNLDLQNGRHLELQRVGEYITIAVNGVECGHLRTAKVFDKGQIYFGYQGDTYVSHLDVQPERGGRMTLIDTTTLEVKKEAGDTLQSLVWQRRPDLTIGSAMYLESVLSDAQEAQLIFGGHLGGIVPGNAMKSQYMWPTLSSPQFGEMDAVIELAERHKLRVHGHSLFYYAAISRLIHQADPDTKAGKSLIETYFRESIEQTVSRYKGKIASYDVNNELIKGFARPSYRMNKVWAALGHKFLTLPTELVRRHDPEAKTYYNDFGLTRYPRTRGKWAIDIAQEMGVDGIGDQCHEYKMKTRWLNMRMFTDEIREDQARYFIEQVGKKGMLFRTSEIDVTADGGIHRKAQQFAMMLGLMMEYSHCKDFYMWGMSNRYGSTSKETILGEVLTGNSLPFDAMYRPTPAWFAMMDVARGTPKSLAARLSRGR